ncbi:MAG TPA: pirin family protein [Casimicrobiaceae bacterium]|nr:pirin family protein [Casimicrobiaceae bacterium]
MADPIVTVLKPHARDIGGLLVQRLLPSQPTQMVGPFIFFDHFGPVRFPPGHGIDVRPHPHIGLATVTYLFDGGQVHRDSLGNVQAIAPGDVNWMTAGRGIVHSERSGPGDRASGHLLHGLQTWVALPKAREQAEPSFSHHPKATLPEMAHDGVTMRLLAGTAFGQRAPTPTFSPMLYLAVDMRAGATLDLPPEHEERGVYVVDGDARIGDTALPIGHIAVLEGWTTVRIEAAAATRLVVIGGARVDGERLIWWNFVASSQALIDAASARWRQQEYPAIPGETEFIPLPP